MCPINNSKDTIYKEIRNSRESRLFFGNLAIYGACKAWATLRGHSTTKYVDKKF